MLSLSNLFRRKSAFEKKYKLGRDLGKGAFSTVKLATDVKNKEQYAAKVLVRAKMTREDEAAVQGEIKILTEVRGAAGVVELVYFFQDAKHHYIVMELMSGGELFQRIVKREAYTEHDAKNVVENVALVLQFIHARGIAHRDLKPENVLLKDQSENAAIKIADFGFARHVGQDGCKTACGTPAYVAPEVIDGKVYDMQCDVWSLGVIMYVLLCGYPPFYAARRPELFQQIRAGVFKFDSAFWGHITPQAKELISKMLVVDPKQRYTATQVLEHEWVTGVNSRDAIDAGRLKLFNAKRHLRGAFTTAIAAGKIHDLVKHVKKQKQQAAMD